MFSQLCRAGQSCPAASGDTSCCPAAERLLQSLREHFKFTVFRPGQLEALLPVIHGRDVFVRMATGAGKSLCMFLGPLAASTTAVGLVISPLTGLMDQQVRELSDIGIPGIRVKKESSFSDVAVGKYRFVFMFPELAVSPPWRNLFDCVTFKRKLVLIAVDEAHCIPEWGSDFRVTFSQLGGLRALVDVPFMALTASAPPQVQNEIISSLHMDKPVVISLPLDRPNIYLSAIAITTKPRDLAGLMAALSSPEPLQIPKTVVFCQTKDKAAQVHELLRRSACQKHTVSMYHASLTEQTKSFIQRAFLSTHTELRCLVASVAFGMGMNIPDIELVIVYGAPGSVSQFYQLCGRSGRSGIAARAHLFYTVRGKIKDSALQTYCCKTPTCRRSSLLHALGSSEEAENSTNCCDVCCTSCPYDRLNIVTPARRQNKRNPPKARLIGEDLSKELRCRLSEERKAILEEMPAYKMLGVNYVCPDAVLDELCSRASYITSVDHLDIFCLRASLRERFYKVIKDCVSCAPPAKRRRL